MSRDKLMRDVHQSNPDRLLLHLREQADTNHVGRTRNMARNAANEIERLRAENERLKEALTLIEMFYYMEARADKWRAAKMNGVARDAQNGETLAPYRRMFPRATLGKDDT